MNAPALIPIPTSIHLSGKSSALPSSWKISGPAPAECTRLLHELKGNGKIMKISFSLRAASSRGPEAYTLAISKDALTITAAAEIGMIHAVRTLTQLASGGRLPHGKINDYPRYAIRGVMLDLSRGRVLKPEYLKKLVDQLAMMKMNMIQLYMENNYEIPGMPEFSEGEDPLTDKEIKNLVKHAQKRHVDLVPAIQTFGHMEKFLWKPEFMHMAESSRGISISPAVRSSYSFLKKSINHVASLFPSEWINIGCDEVWDLAQGKSASMAKKKSREYVFSSHLAKVNSMVKAAGKKSIMWGDIALNYPGILKTLPRDIVIANWNYITKKPLENVRFLDARGFSQILCPGARDWRSFFPNLHQAHANIGAMAASNRGTKHVLGAVVTAWGDDGASCPAANGAVGLAMGADAFWSRKPADFHDFFLNYGKVVTGSAMTGKAIEEMALAANSKPEVLTSLHDLMQMDPFDNLTSRRFVEDNMKDLSAHLDKAAKLLVSADDNIFTMDLHTSLDIYRWLHRRSEVAKDISRKMFMIVHRKKRGLARTFFTGALKDLDSLVSECAALKKSYRKSWLSTSKPSRLDLHMDRFDRAADLLRMYRRRLAGMQKKFLKTGRLPEKTGAFHYLNFAGF